MQEGILFQYLLNPESDEYFEQIVLHLSGKLEINCFSQAWNQVIKTNEMLRTVIRWEKLDRPVQLILKPQKLEIPLTDLRSLSADEQVQQLNEYLSTDRQQKFDLQNGPLIRLNLFRLDEAEYELIISNHHIIYDGWSTGILLKELIQYYHQLYKAEPLSIQRKTPFKEYLKWIQSRDQGQSKRFWHDYLLHYEEKTCLPIDWKTDKTIRDIQHKTHYLGRELSIKLQKIAGSERVTLASIFYAALGLLLQRYNRSSIAVFGTTVSGRPGGVQGIEEMVGLFINTLPLVVESTPDQPFIDLIQNLNKDLINRQQFENLPLVEIKAVSQLDSKESLFDVLVVVENYPLATKLNEQATLLKITNYTTHEMTNFDLTMEIQTFEEISITMGYNPHVFAGVTIERILGHFFQILNNFTQNPELLQEEIELLTPGEKTQLLKEFNNLTIDLPMRDTIDQLFSEQVSRTPDIIALSYADQRITYRELDRRSTQLAHLIQQKGVQPDQLVGIMAERSIAMVVGLLGILKSGAGYLPLEVTYPVERISYMLDDSKTELVLAQSDLLHKIPNVNEVIQIDKLRVDEKYSKPLQQTHNPNHLAYVIYTSGSTGRPKGVMVEHHSVLNCIGWMDREFGLDVGDVVIQRTNLTFDPSVWEIFWPLLKGGRVRLLSTEQGIDAQYLLNLMAEKSTSEVRTLMYCPASLVTGMSNLLESLEMTDEKPLQMAILFIGAESIRMDVVKQFYQYFAGQIVNTYGPTECTINNTYYYLKPDDSRQVVPIGQPVDNNQIYILSKEKQLMPINIPGEIYIAGASLARGYLHNSDKTQEVFLNNPFGPGRIYKTGDLGRWLEDGNVEYLGRVDDQVKIRGYRIELGEIESQLINHPQVQEAVVVAREGENGDKFLIGYYTVDSALLEKDSGFLKNIDLRDHLLKRLPDYMVPNYFMELENLPLTSNGKIDRKALPDVSEMIDTGVDYIPPNTEIELRLKEIWSKILGVAKISVIDDFFHIGGHSLKATQLSSKIMKEFAVNIPLKVIFEKPTIRQLAEEIELANKRDYSIIQKIETSASYPVSSAQKRMYILHQLEEDSTVYNMTGIIKIQGDLVLEEFTKACHTLIQRHESLRTSFIQENGEPQQVVHDTVPFAIEIIDWPHDLQVENAVHNLLGIDREDINSKKDNQSLQEFDQSPQMLKHRLLESVIQKFVKPFDLQKAPLLRMRLQRIMGENYLLVDLHHIISDGTSINILFKELASIYSGEELTELTVQYKDYAVWQSNYLRSDQYRKEEDYWLKQYSDEIPVLNLPSDYVRPAVLEFSGDTFNYVLDEVLSQSLKELAKAQGVTLFMLLLAAYQIFLAKYTGQDEMVIGTPVAGRVHPDLESVIGMFVNTVAIRGKLTSEESFTDLLVRVRETTLEAFENQDYQFDMLVDKLALERDLSRNPIFETMFALQNVEQSEFHTPGLHLLLEEYSNHVARFDLLLDMTEREKQLACRFEYRTRLFKKETISRMAENFKNLLLHIVASPERRISELELISPVEKAQLLYGFNTAHVVFQKEKTIHELFEEQVERCPDKIAVIYENSSLSYRELNNYANQLGRVLRTKGVKPNQPVAIIAESEMNTIVGILAIIKAGGAYLPLDPVYPVERLEYMLTDAQVELLLTSSKGIIELNQVCEVIFIDQSELYQGDTENLPIINTPNDLIYIIYTSGSTGNPKGVMIEHINVNRLVSNSNLLAIEEDDRVLQLGSLAFDASTFELWSPLTHGATVCLILKDEVLSGEILGKRMEEYGITMIFITASLFNLYAEKNPEIFAPLRVLMVGGEALSPKHIAIIRQRYPYLHIFNAYGPTECTTFAVFFEIPVDYFEEQRSSIPIGRPVSNTQLYVLDKNSLLSPIGVFGELCIGGEGVARGYLNQSELTKEKFIQLPQIPDYRVYRTGDLVRWMPEGVIEFGGRIDHQVKIRGFRIELGEIESKLLTHPAIEEAVVIAEKDVNGVGYLIAYLVLKTQVEVSAIRQYLIVDLPEYMVPAHFIYLKELPLNANGKVNRRALPKPEINAQRGVSYVKPRNVIEQELADIWSEILGIQKISINDHFFHLGGHSLKATQMVSRIAQSFKINIPLRSIFVNPTIAELAAQIVQIEKNGFTSIEPIAKADYYPASSAQKRLYLIEELTGPNITYNLPVVLQVEGNLDRVRLQDTLNALVSRHEALRTSFKIVEEELVQVITDSITVKILELTVVSEDIDEVIRKWIRPFNLYECPLIRVAIMSKGNTEYLIFDMHHIISDGFSLGILIKDFIQLYQNVKLPELKIQYKDFTVWQNRLLDSHSLNEQEEYWLAELSGELPVLNLTSDFPRPAVFNFQGDVVMFSISADIALKLNELCENQSVTLYMLLLASYSVLLEKYTHQQDILIGSPILGRSHADLEKVIGMFVNTLVMRTRPKGESAFTDFLSDVKNIALRAYENQDYQFEMLVEKLALPRDLSRNPIFDVVFALQNNDHLEFSTSGLQLTPYELRDQIAKFDLMLTVEQMRDVLNCRLVYSTQLFKKEMMELMAEHYLNLLQSIVNQPQTLLKDLSIISHEEIERLLFEFNRTEVPFAKKLTIQELFENQVRRNSSAQAVVYGEAGLTYDELNTRSNQLARQLRSKGVRANQAVGIMAVTSLETVIGILAIIKAGGAYLPIDPEYPIERIEFMLRDADVQILLTPSKEDFLLAGLQEIISIGDPVNYQGDSSNLLIMNRADDLIYIIYTSGSTGKPKGVMIEHINVNRLVSNSSLLTISETDRVLQLGSLAFDASTFELWSPLTQGAAVYLIERDEVLSGDILAKKMGEYGITMIFMTTSLFNLYAEKYPEVFSTLHTLLVGGEAVSPKHMRLIKERYPKLHLYNAYGPTETTTFAAAYEVSTEFLDSVPTNIPIGRPISNTQLYILDKDQKICPIGVPGELCIGGEGVARGYLNQPELTRERFIRLLESDKKIYRTGDLTRWLSSGVVEYLGRIDHQVKIRGYRIELGEIENQLLTHPEIKDAVIVAFKDETETGYLAAYYVATIDVKVNDLRNHLAAQLPDYMIPTYWVSLEALPLNANGKVDRKALPDPLSAVALEDCEELVSDTEIRLGTIWKHVLGVGEISRESNFFEMGGHSLKATQLKLQITNEFGVELALRDIFRHSALKVMAEQIDQLQAESSAKVSRIMIQPVLKAEYYPLSYAQKRLWYLAQLHPESSAYNMPARIRLQGKVECQQIQEVLDILLARHESYRTWFTIIEGTPMQVIEENVNFKIHQIDLTELPVEERWNKIEEIYNEEARRPFMLEAPPLFRAVLVRMEQTRSEKTGHDGRKIASGGVAEFSELIFNQHHIISDGWSTEVITREFYQLYEAVKTQQKVELSPLPIQYKDFAVWQNQYLSDQEQIQEAQEFWKAELSKLKPLMLPLDYLQADNSQKGAAYRLVIPVAVKESLHQLAETYETSIFTVLLAGFELFLARLTGQDTIMVGVPIAGRDHPDLHNVVGFFVNTTIAGVTVNPEESFTEFLQDVKENMFKILSYQSYPLELIIDELRIPYPKISAFFNMLNMGESATETLADMNCYHIDSVPEVKFEIMCYLKEYANGIEVRCHYLADAFNLETIEVIMGRYLKILQEVAENPHQCLNQYGQVKKRRKLF